MYRSKICCKTISIFYFWLIHKSSFVKLLIKTFAESYLITFNSFKVDGEVAGRYRRNIALSMSTHICLCIKTRENSKHKWLCHSYVLILVTKITLSLTLQLNSSTTLPVSFIFNTKFHMCCYWVSRLLRDINNWTGITKIMKGIKFISDHYILTRKCWFLKSRIL